MGGYGALPLSPTHATQSTSVLAWRWGWGGEGRSSDGQWPTTPSALSTTAILSSFGAKGTWNCSVLCGVWGLHKLVSREGQPAVWAPLQAVDNPAPWAGTWVEVLQPRLIPPDPHGGRREATPLIVL